MKTYQGAKKNYFALSETPAVPDRMFRLALNEAEALAWQTDYPQLVFPILATEKTQAVTEWNARQERLHQKDSVRVMSN
jgi:hypothetical protein